MTPDPTTTNTKSGRKRMLGFGAFACLACCTGPLLAGLGAISIAATATTLLAGTTGLLVVAAAAPLLLRSHKQPTCAPPNTGPTVVASPIPRPHVDAADEQRQPTPQGTT